MNDNHVELIGNTFGVAGLVLAFFNMYLAGFALTIAAGCFAYVAYSQYSSGK